MAIKKAISLDNNTYWDSSAIVNENNETLDGMFSGNKSMGNIVVDSIRGKNLLRTTARTKTENGVTWTVNNDGTISLSGTASGYTSLEIGSASVNTSMGTVIVSGLANATNVVWDSITLYDVSGTSLATIGAGALSNQTINLSNYATVATIKVVVKRQNNASTSGIIRPQLEKGTSATTFSPYNVYGSNELKNENVVVGTIRSKNLFNINGDVNVKGTDTTVHSTSNTVNNGVLTCDYNSANSQGFGQIITGLSGKKITFTAKCTSNGTGSGIYIGIYENGAVKMSEGIQAGDTEYITYTPISNTTIFTFSTVSGTGAQVTNIQVELGDKSTTYAPYQELNNMDVYSTNEVKIGTWIDGKPLYRKVIQYTNSSSIGASGGISEVSIPHGISNFSQCVSISGVTSSANILPILSIATGQSTLSQSISVAYVDGNNITLRLCNYVLGSKTFYFTMVYAKSS